MKFLFIATLLMSSAAFADHHDEKGKSLDEIKTQISTNIDEKISALNSHKACVQGASSKEAFHACRKSQKETMGKLKQGNKEKRKEWKEKKKAERASEKEAKKK